MEVKRLDLPREPKALMWRADELVDPLGGGRIGLDGSMTLDWKAWGQPFDRAAAPAEGDFAVLYLAGGTKGIVLRLGRFVREINRSYYHASSYEYPVAVVCRPDGRDLLVHCPNRYDRLHIDDAATGERLTERETASPDFFHSRLAPSPDGRRLLSAGWYWHPVGVLRVFDLDEALRRPEHLDEAPRNPFGIDAEVAAACWLDDDRIAVATNNEHEVDRDEDDEPGLDVDRLAVLSLSAGAFVADHPSPGTLGPILGLASGRVLALFGHPRLIDPIAGAVLQEWPEIAGSRQAHWGLREEPEPPYAVDARRERVAVANGDRLFILDDRV